MEDRLYAHDLANKVAGYLSDGKLSEYEFLYTPTSTLFRIRETPERLRSHSEYRLVVRNIRSNPQYFPKQLKACLKAMQTSTLKEAEVSLDIRYGFLVRDKQGNEVLRLFMNISNDVVQINDQTLRVQGDLIKWLMQFARDITRDL